MHSWFFPRYAAQRPGIFFVSELAVFRFQLFRESSLGCPQRRVFPFTVVLGQQRTPERPPTRPQFVQSKFRTPQGRQCLQLGPPRPCVELKLRTRWLWERALCLLAPAKELDLKTRLRRLIE